MFIESTHRIIFQTPKQKILKILPAFNCTFVVLVVITAGEKEQVLHVDENGNELFSYTSIDTINFMTMLSDRCVAFCDIDENVIRLINL
jgi:hypothetical protein